jgi:hypothetical protein
LCAKGTYSSTTGLSDATGCEACPSGKVAALASNGCTPCLLGQFQASSGAVACESCLVCALPNLSFACALGLTSRWASNAPAISDEFCPHRFLAPQAGTFSSSQAASSCTACAVFTTKVDPLHPHRIFRLVTDDPTIHANRQSLHETIFHPLEVVVYKK